MKNPQFIRDVVVLHFSDCASLSSAGRESNKSIPLTCVRNFKLNSPVKDLPKHLLTVSILDDLPDCDMSVSSKCNERPLDSTVHGMIPYVLTEAAQRTWGFPLPLPCSTEEFSKTECGNDSRKRKHCDVGTNSPGNSSRVTTSTSSSRSLREEKTNVSKCSFTGEEGYLGGCVALPSKNEALMALEKFQHDGLTCIVSPPSTMSKNSDKSETGVGEDEYIKKKRLFYRTSHHKNLECGTMIDEKSTLDLSVVALDCEMCDTAGGPELTRFTLVDYNGIIVLDSLVKPYDPIIDYKEKYSGINANMLENVQIRIEQVQVALLNILSPCTVIVGHSLENDFYALNILHKCFVDTSVIYPHSLGFPHRHKLKYLAKEHLKLNIQNSSSNSSGVGHSSAEDARIALQLAKLKVEKGPLFGIKSSQDCPREPIVAKLPDTVNTTFIFSGEQLEKRRRGCLGCGIHCKSCADNASTIDYALRHLENVSPRQDLTNDRNFTYIELSGCKHGENAIPDKLEKLYDFVERVKSNLAQYSNRDVLLVVSCQSSVQEVFDLQSRKLACTKAMSASSWSSDLEADLERKKVECRYSDVELFVIQSPR